MPMLRRLLSARDLRLRAKSGLGKIFGFGLSVILGAAAAIVSIPAMIAASGEAAWGAIALGQAVGGVAAVAVGYGWGLSGPAKIAREDATGRRVEYLESVYLRVVLAFPASAVAAVIAYLLAPHMPYYAAVGAISSTSFGFTAIWYFIGLARPLPLLTLETLPRVAAVLAGVALMYMGHSAIVGPVSVLVGMAAAFALSTIWIVRETKRNGAEARRLRRLTAILAQNRHGVVSAMGVALYHAAPLAIVSFIAPTIQPAFALIDRVRRQMNILSTRAVTFLQGWVPRGRGPNRFHRANIALALVGGLALLVGVITPMLAPHLLHWLSNGQTSVSLLAMVMMAACISAALFQSALERTALATFGRLHVAARAIVAGSVVGMPIIGLGAYWHSVSWALGGVLIGLLVCVAIELIDYIRVVIREPSTELAPALVDPGRHAIAPVQD